MQAGDKVTIRRGKLKGQAGEVIAHQSDPAAYVLKLGDGTHQVVNATNVIEPTEATIAQAELAAIINSLEVDHANGHDVAISELVHAIDSKYPGFASKVGLPDVGRTQGTDA